MLGFVFLSDVLLLHCHSIKLSLNLNFFKKSNHSLTGLITTTDRRCHVKSFIVQAHCSNAGKLASRSGVATGLTRVDMKLLLEVPPEIDTNPTTFYTGGGVPGSAPPPDRLYTLALDMFVQNIFGPGDARGFTRPVRYALLADFLLSLQNCRNRCC